MPHAAPATQLAALACLLVGLFAGSLTVHAWLGRSAGARSFALARGRRSPDPGVLGLWLTPAAAFFFAAASFMIPSFMFLPLAALPLAGLGVLCALVGLAAGLSRRALITPSWAEPALNNVPQPPDDGDPGWPAAASALAQHLAMQGDQTVVLRSKMSTVAVTQAPDGHTVAAYDAGDWQPKAWWEQAGFYPFGSVTVWRADQLNPAEAGDRAVAALRIAGAQRSRITASSAEGRLDLGGGNPRRVKRHLQEHPAVDTGDLQAALGA